MAMTPELEVTMMPTGGLVPYVGNAKRHPEWQVEQIAASIEAFGFNDPIAVWHDVAGHPVIVEGHGRLLAAKMLGMEEVPVVTLDHLDDEGRRAYTLAHNQTNLTTGFDLQTLDAELDAIEGFDMAEFGFEVGEPAFAFSDGAEGQDSRETIVVRVTFKDEKAYKRNRQKFSEMEADGAVVTVSE